MEKKKTKIGQAKTAVQMKISSKTSAGKKMTPAGKKSVKKNVAKNDEVLTPISVEKPLLFEKDETLEASASGVQNGKLGEVTSPQIDENAVNENVQNDEEVPADKVATEEVNVTNEEVGRGEQAGIVAAELYEEQQDSSENKPLDKHEQQDVLDSKSTAENVDENNSEPGKTTANDVADNVKENVDEKEEEKLDGAEENLTSLEKIVAKQRNFFATNKTLDVSFRLLQLKRLKLQIKAYYDQICAAFRADLNKQEFDVVLTELGLVMNEINFMIANLSALAKPKRARTSFANFPSKAYVLHDPYGVVMVASPWNYPLQLTLIPLIGAIAGGNTVIVKPSRSTPNVTKVIKKMLSIFDEEYVYVVTKNDEIESIFDTKFDFIFYTGSPKMARELAQKQAKFLTPMILELGGKSPCIVDKDANIDLSAKRIVWGKFLNAGQTCVAPDYVLVHSDIKDKFVECAKKWVRKFYYEHHLGQDKDEFLPSFVKIAKKSDVFRLQNLIKSGTLECGGKVHGQMFEPTILSDVSWSDEIMQEEVFGPVMPVMTFEDLDVVISKLKTMDKPLALYYFGKDKECIAKVKSQLSFGGGCINDTIVHLSEETLPFGGVGNSGMGNYHGAKTFYAFTREKSVLEKALWLDINLRYPQASGRKIKRVKRYFKI